MIDVRPFSVLKIDAGVKNALIENEAARLALFWKGGRMFRVFSAVDVESSEIVGHPLDARETHADATVGVRSAEPAAVAPGEV